MASYLGAAGARLVVLHGSDELELLELDFESGTARTLASFSATVGTTRVSTVAFDAEGARIGSCGPDGASLRVLDDAGGERTLPFPPAIEGCTSVGFADGDWLVVAQEPMIPATATLMRIPSSLASIRSVPSIATMRPFVSGGPPLFDAGDGYAFVYRPFELDSWPDEPLRLQRLGPTFEPSGDPVELLEPMSINGAVWSASEGGALFVIFRPQFSALITGDGPHFRAFDERGRPRGPPVPLLASGYGLNFALHATGAGLYWFWVDPGEDFDPGRPASASRHRSLLQPLSRAGEGLAPPLPLYEAPRETAIRAVIQSRVDGDRHDLLVAWQGVGVGGGLRSVHAALVECRR